MAAPVLQFKRGLLANLPGLRAGEPGFTTDSYDLYVGLTSETSTNRFFGSHRYWEREETSVKPLDLKLVSDNGTESINLRSPISLGATFTYTLPATAIGYSGKILSTNEEGILSWVDQINVLGIEEIVIGIGTFTQNVAFTTTTQSTSSTTGAVTIVGGLGVGGTSYFGSDLNVGGNLDVTGITTIGSGGFLDVNSGADFAGITTFSSTEDNTLGDPNTGAVQIDGGLGVEKNVTVGAGLSVAGQSYFIGTATFYGGTLNLGDSDTDDINVAGEFISNLVPNTNDTYDIGNGAASKSWRHASFSGIGTFSTGLVGDSVRLGIGGAGTVDTTSGNLTLDSASGLTVINDEVNIYGNLDVSGNISLGGTTITLRGEDVFIENKDIVLGYTTSITPNDTTANHAGVAIASTEGTPLVDFNVSGINTLPNTYKQLMWFQNGTLGFATDAFAFNYAVAVGTTVMANGVRFAVGSGITMTDDAITATNFYGTFNGSITGNSPTADQVKTINATDTDANYYITFVDSDNGSATDETVYTDDGIYYNPGTNKLTTQNAEFTNNVLVSGITTVGTGVGITQFSSSVSTGTSTSSVPTSSAVIDYVNAADIGLAGDTGSGSVNTTQTLTINGTASEIVTSASGQTITVGLPDDVIIGAALTVTGALDVNGGGTIDNIQIGVTGDNEIDTSTGNLTIDSAGGTVTIDDELIVSGDVRINGNDIKASDGTTAITLSAANVTVAGDLTVGGNDIKASDGTTALTLADSTGAVTAANDLTVQGNLYVSGNTTQVNTTALTVEDRTIDLGIVNGATPASATTWDLGILFNYNSSGAKKSAVIWEHADTRFKFASVLGADTNGTDNDTPQLSVTTFAPIEIGSLWVTDCAGTSQVISCTGTERFLENITVDAGAF